MIAFSLGTTVLIKMGRSRYLWVTLAPLGWLLAVTLTASWMKLFSPAPVGFIAIAHGFEAKVAAGGRRPNSRCGARRS
ncbi:MAG: carbon starvation CstA 5TM domain-containing protein [Lacunisphaera sp.]